MVSVSKLKGKGKENLYRRRQRNTSPVITAPDSGATLLNTTCIKSVQGNRAIVGWCPR